MGSYKRNTKTLGFLSRFIMLNEHFRVSNSSHFCTKKKYIHYYLICEYNQETSILSIYQA